jgi:hypothetical protein
MKVGSQTPSHLQPTLPGCLVPECPSMTAGSKSSEVEKLSQLVSRDVLAREVRLPSKQPQRCVSNANHPRNRLEPFHLRADTVQASAPSARTLNFAGCRPRTEAVQTIAENLNRKLNLNLKGASPVSSTSKQHPTPTPRSKCILGSSIAAFIQPGQ